MGAGSMTRQYRFLNDAPLNDANFGREMTFLEGREARRPQGRNPAGSAPRTALAGMGARIAENARD